MWMCCTSYRVRVNNARHLNNTTAHTHTHNTTNTICTWARSAHHITPYHTHHAILNTPHLWSNHSHTYDIPYPTHHTISNTSYPTIPTSMFRFITHTPLSSLIAGSRSNVVVKNIRSMVTRRPRAGPTWGPVRRGTYVCVGIWVVGGCMGGWMSS